MLIAASAMFLAVLALPIQGPVLIHDAGVCNFELQSCLAEELEMQAELTRLRKKVLDLEEQMDTLRINSDQLAQKIELYEFIHEKMEWTALVLLALFTLVFLTKLIKKHCGILFAGMFDYVQARLGFVRAVPRPSYEMQVLIESEQRPTPASPNFVLEGDVQGSTYKTTEKYPKMQFEIRYSSVTGVKVAGQGIWLENYLVTSGHIMTEMENLGVETVLLVTPRGQIPVAVNQWNLKDKIDLAFLPHNQSTMQPLGLSKANVVDGKFNASNIPGRIYTMRQYTDGIILERQNGMVWYKGSTKKGFSGAPYMWDNKVVGIHQGSEHYAYGLDIKLVESFIPVNQLESGVTGTGEQMIREIVEDFYKNKTKYDMHLVPGETRIRYKGKFVTIEDDELTDELSEIINYSVGQRSFAPSPRVTLESGVTKAEKEKTAEIKLAVDSLAEVVGRMTSAMDNSSKVMLNSLRESVDSIKEEHDSIAQALKKLEPKYVDAPSAAGSTFLPKNLQSPPSVEASGKIDPATDAQRLEKRISGLQSQISKLASMINSTGRTPMPAQRRRASPST